MHFARYFISPNELRSLIGTRKRQAAGLPAVSLGLSALAGADDHGLLQAGFMVYDAPLAYIRFAARERHNWPAQAA